MDNDLATLMNLRMLLTKKTEKKKDGNKKGLVEHDYEPSIKWKEHYLR